MRKPIDYKYLKKVALSTNVSTQSIVELLKKDFENLSNDVGVFGNIYTVFFHDLVVHFSGLLMHRYAIQEYPHRVIFPVCNKSYAMSPHVVKQDYFIKSQSIRNPKLLLRQFSLSGLGVGVAIPFTDRHEKHLSVLINIFGSFKPFVKAYLPNRQEQIGRLLDSVHKISELYEIPNSELVQANWRDYVDYHTTSIQPAIREDCLLLGTRNSLQNRKLAVNYLQQNKEVIAVTHGEVANSVMDEPSFGYSERTLCKTLIDYGDFDENGTYNEPLINPSRIWYRSAPSVSSYYRKDYHIRLTSGKKYKALYIVLCIFSH